jgi:hypothetical protein
MGVSSTSKAAMRLLPTLLLALPLISTAQAQEVAPGLAKLAENGRYQLLEINDRVIRLDAHTGVFDLCVMTGGAWTCSPTQDRSRELTEQIAALTQRVEALEAEQREAAAEKERGIVSRLGDYVPGLGK